MRYGQLVDGLRSITRAGFAHGDLSAYNLLWWQGEVWFIDFPQAVDIAANLQGLDFLHRDVVNVCTWFRASGRRRRPRGPVRRTADPSLSRVLRRREAPAVGEPLMGGTLTVHALPAIDHDPLADADPDVVVIAAVIDIESWLSTGGLALLAAIVFAETGLLVGFFLPGDSLLFMAGFLASEAGGHVLPPLPDHRDSSCSSPRWSATRSATSSVCGSGRACSAVRAVACSTR